MTFSIYLHLVTLLFSSSMQGLSDENARECIVWLNQAAASNTWEQIQQESPRSFRIKPIRRLSPSLAIYLIKINSQSTNNQCLNHIKKHPLVKTAQWNHSVQWRGKSPRKSSSVPRTNTPIPNDLYYDRQWALAKIQAPTAWQFTTGPTNFYGDTLVTAIIDSGTDFEHEDLHANLWYNWNEIPNNGIDDDNNGYIDDFKGWNLDTRSDAHPRGSHGTSVSGIIGAQTNNKIGVAGILWNTRTMVISADDKALLTEAGVIEAYSYALEQRIIYNKTQGKKGAFVTVINASFGLDKRQARDFPIWCSLYDSLGAHGILSVASTANERYNVDVVGDMPTSCPSPYLITVTESTPRDLLDSDAAYGVQSIDLAAPGAVFTTRIFNAYNTFGGTSGAAPHVSASLNLLYSLPNPLWAQRCKENPAEAALELKKILLQEVDQTEALKQQTHAGGRLNLGAAMTKLNETYTEPLRNRLVALFPNPTRQFLQIKTETLEAGTYKFYVYNTLGQRLLHKKVTTERSRTLYVDFDLQLLPTGTYFVRCQHKNWQETKAIVKF